MFYIHAYLHLPLSRHAYHWLFETTVFYVYFVDVGAFLLWTIVFTVWGLPCLLLWVYFDVTWSVLEAVTSWRVTFPSSTRRRRSSRDFSTPRHRRGRSLSRASASLLMKRFVGTGCCGNVQWVVPSVGEYCVMRYTFIICIPRGWFIMSPVNFLGWWGRRREGNLLVDRNVACLCCRDDSEGSFVFVLEILFLCSSLFQVQNSASIDMQLSM